MNIEYGLFLAQKNILTRARSFAIFAHAGQTRKNGKDYIEHPKKVYNTLNECGYYDTALMASSYLHDVCEETDTTIDEIEYLFGKDISDYVSKVTRNCSDHEYNSRIEKAPAHIRILKLADFADVTSDMQHLSSYGIEKKLDEGWNFYFPMAMELDHRLAKKIATNLLLYKEMERAA